MGEVLGGGIPAGGEINPIAMFLAAGTVVKIVVIGLVFASLASWAKYKSLV